MVAPVTGPINTSETRLGSPNMYGYRPVVYSLVRSRYRQKKPFNLSLPYSMTRQTASIETSDPADYADASYNAEHFVSSHGAIAETRAYNRFRENAYKSASLGVTLAERKQAISMMQSRLIGLYRFSRSLRKLNFSQAWRDLGMRPPTKGWRPQSRHYGGMWLEYHFGWKPLVKDILDVMEILDKPFPYNPVFGSGSVDQVISLLNQHTDTATNYTHWVTLQNLKYSCKYGAFIEVVNPNVHLAASMGLINPLVLAWELIPFSFLVDWFSGIGNWLQSFTDFLGCRFINPWSLSMIHGVESDNYRAVQKSFVSSPPAGGPGYWIYTPRYTIKTRTYHRMTRGTNTPVLPRPTFSLPDRLSVTRGVTAVSLLLQQFR